MLAAPSRLEVAARLNRILPALHPTAFSVWLVFAVTRRPPRGPFVCRLVEFLLSHLTKSAVAAAALAEEITRTLLEEGVLEETDGRLFFGVLPGTTFADVEGLLTLPGSEPLGAIGGPIGQGSGPPPAGPPALPQRAAEPEPEGVVRVLRPVVLAPEERFLGTVFPDAEGPESLPYVLGGTSYPHGQVPWVVACEICGVKAKSQKFRGVGRIGSPERTFLCKSAKNHTPEMIAAWEARRQPTLARVG